MKYSTKHWSKELEKYKNGTQSDAERYQLEKSALDDVFLFEALEGYSNNAVASKDNDIAPGAAKSGATIFSIRNIAVAASLVMLVGIVGYMQTQFGDNNQEQSIAAVEIDESEEEASENEKAIAMNIEPSGTPEEEDTAKRTTATTSDVASDTPPQQNTIKEPKQAVEQELAQKTTVEQAKQKTTTLAVDEIAAKEEEVQSDVAEVKANKPLSKKNNGSRLNLAPSKEDLKSSENNTLAMSIDGAKLSNNNNMLTPPMGWDGFEAYIAKNKKKIATLKKVVVEVTFTVAPDGKLSNVKTNDTSCQSCEEEAIRLIKYSGVWKNLNGQAQEMIHKIAF